MEVTKKDLPSNTELENIDLLKILELQGQIEEFITFLNSSVISEEVPNE